MLKLKTTGNLVVKPQLSQRAKLAIGAGAAAALLLAASAIYNYGSINADFDRNVATREYDHLEDELKRSHDENQELRESLARAQRGVQMNQTAFQELERALKASSQEIVKLREELNFYRNIISPLDNKVGLRIQDLAIEALGAQEYRYKLVLIQALKHERTVLGSAAFEVSGTQGGVETVFKVSAPIRVNFKYFQDVVGKFVLPNNFKPRQIKVSVTPSNGAAAVEETYTWPLA